MADVKNLKLFETTVLKALDSFTGVAVERFRLVTGARVVFTLVVTAIDVGAVVSVDIENGFSNDVVFDSVESFSRSSIGSTTRIISDAHNLFNVSISVAGGDATFALGVTVVDAASDGSGGGGGDAPVADLLTQGGVQGTLTIGLTPVSAKVGAGAYSGRKLIYLQPNGNGLVFGFTAGVTPSTGTKIFKDQIVPIAVSEDVEIFLVNTSGPDVVCRIAEAG